MKGGKQIIYEEEDIQAIGFHYMSAFLNSL